MPTERFYRLPESKKLVIREAAVKEFARVPFEKASINQIIHNADISRGSFYTYFEDKQDVVRFIFEDSFSQMRAVCEEELSNNGGDYFAMISRLFELFVDELQNTTEMMEVVRNVFSYQENTKFLGFEGLPCPVPPEEDDAPAKWIYNRIDRSRFAYSTVEEFLPLLTLGVTAMLYSVRQYYQYPDQIDAIRNTFHKSIELLKYGAYRR